MGSEPGFLVFVTSAGKSGLKTPPGSEGRGIESAPDTGGEHGPRNTTSGKVLHRDGLDHRHVQS